MVKKEVAGVEVELPMITNQQTDDANLSTHRILFDQSDNEDVELVQESKQQASKSTGFKRCYSKLEYLLLILFNWKRSAIRFQPYVESIVRFDQPLLHNTVAVIMALNQTSMLIFTIIPYFVSESAAVNMLSALVGYYFFFEVVMLLIIRTKISLSFFSSYLLIKFVSGLLKKATLLSLGFIGGHAAQTNQTGGILFGIVLLCAVGADQLKILQKVYNLLSIDRGFLFVNGKVNNKSEETREMNIVYPYIERTQRLAELLNFQGLLITLKRFTLMPSNQSELLSLKIALDLNPDLVKLPKTGISSKITEFSNQIYQNSLARHIFLIDVIVVLAIIISITSITNDYSLKYHSISAVIILVIFDTLSCVFELLWEEDYTSLDADLIYDKACIRNELLAQRYAEVLMKEKELTSDRSLFDSKVTEEVGEIEFSGDKKLQVKEETEPHALSDISLIQNTAILSAKVIQLTQDEELNKGSLGFQIL